MSETPASRAWLFYIDDMIGFCEKVVLFTQGMNQPAFESDVLRFDATLRNQLIHGYLGIDNDTLWSIVEGDVPTLLTKLRLLKANQR
jgi:uncharacterized protein with HEPN domain